MGTHVLWNGIAQISGDKIGDGNICLHVHHINRHLHIPHRFVVGHELQQYNSQGKDVSVLRDSAIGYIFQKCM